MSAPQVRQRIEQGLGVLRARRRELGVGGAALATAKRAVDGVSRRLEDELLRIEGRRGVLGPAHRGYSRNSVAANQAAWSTWDWSAGGEEWTESPEWKQALIDDVLRATMPAGGTLLEIGPGAGRWTQALLERADRLVLVDLTERTLDLCRERLGDPPGVEYICCGGSDLGGVGDRTIDGVWAFDVFVHVAPLDTAAYLDELARVLAPGGVAVVHHAGGSDRRARADDAGWRSPMTARLFAALARERGLIVERQFDSWGGGHHSVRAWGDVISTLRARPHRRPVAERRLRGAAERG